MNHPTPTPPGWYPDPRGHFPHRWWNGQAWTDSCLNGNGQSVISKVNPTSSTTPWKAIGFVVAGLVVLGVIGSVLSPPEDRIESVAASSEAIERSTESTKSTTTPEPTIQDQIGEWQANYGYLIQGMIDSFDRVSTLAAEGDVYGVGEECANMDEAIRETQDAPPIPDAEADRHFQAALTEFRLGATDCVAGVAVLDPSLIGQASDHFAAGTVEMELTTARLEEIR